MKLCIISGSNRTSSESYRIAQMLAQHPTLSKTFSVRKTVDVASLNIPLWNGEDITYDSRFAPWLDLAETLTQSDALILVTPEWGGMAPPALKNILLLAGSSRLAHKPALIVAVSSGMGGCNPVHELRTNGYKNNHLCFLPDHLILRQVEDRFIDANSEDELAPRLHYTLSLLVEYTKALKQVRTSGVVDVENFPYGMS